MSINSSIKGDELFVLIKTLTKAEKRFFKLYSARYQRENGSHYVRLFDLLDEQKEYNEEQLIKQFKGTAYLKRPGAAKKQLYGHILKALEQYKGHDDTNPKYLFRKAAVLYEKGLYEQSLKVLVKARKRAQLTEDFFTIIETITQERRIISTSLMFASREKQLTALENLEKDCAIKIEEIRRIRELERILFQYYYKYRVMRTGKHQPEYKKKVKELLTMDISRVKSNYAKWLVCNSKGIYFLTIGELDKAQPEFLKAVQILESNEALKLSHPEAAVASVNNYIVISYTLRDFDEALKFGKKLDDLQTVFPGNKDLENAIYGQYNIVLHIHRRRYEYHEALKALTEMEKKFKKSRFIAELTRMHFDYNTACIFLGLGQTGEAMKRITAALNSPEATDKYYLTFYVRIVQLVVLLETKDYELLAYRTRSFYRYMLKRDVLPPFEKLLLEFIRDSIRKINVFDSKQLRDAVIKLKAGFEKILSAPNESNNLDYFDFLSWMESKIERRSFSQVLMEKAGK